jgi:PIN domain nuclease of toxin-antitoxin system
VTPLLLDTHILIWLFEGSSRLPAEQVAIVREHCAANSTFISAITPWEIAVLTAKGRLTLSRDIHSWMEAVFDGYGIALAPLTPDVAIESMRLPGAFHNDPADRIIVASARIMNARLLTADKPVLAYAAQGHVQTV